MKTYVETLKTQFDCFIFTDNEGIFVKPSENNLLTSIGQAFASAFGGFGDFGELQNDAVCNDLYYIRTQKQFVSGDKANLDGYWEYTGTYEYRESENIRTARAFKRATGFNTNMSDFCKLKPISE